MLIKREYRRWIKTGSACNGVNYNDDTGECNENKNYEGTDNKVSDEFKTSSNYDDIIKNSDDENIEIARESKKVMGVNRNSKRE